jgi:hypothetical protein
LPVGSSESVMNSQYEFSRERFMLPAQIPRIRGGTVSILA